MKRAVLYARVSTDAQQKGGTIESQVLELKRQIAAAGDVLVKEYVDDGYSGSLLDRPGLEELRRDIRTNLFDAVYFLDTDRIARDVAYQPGFPICRLRMLMIRRSEAIGKAPVAQTRSLRPRRTAFRRSHLAFR
jgi:Resolvase, N terminal domain